LISYSKLTLSTSLNNYIYLLIYDIIKLEEMLRYRGVRILIFLDIDLNILIQKSLKKEVIACNLEEK